MLDSKASLTLTSANLPALLAAANVQAMDAQVNAMVQIDGATASPAELALSLVYAEQVYSADALWTLQSDISDNQASDSVFAIEQGVFFSAEATQISREGVLMSAGSVGESSTAVCLIGANDPGFALI